MAAQSTIYNIWYKGAFTGVSVTSTASLNQPVKKVFNQLIDLGLFPIGLTDDEASTAIVYRENDVLPNVEGTGMVIMLLYVIEERESTWKQIVYDCAEAYRTATRSEDKIKVGQLSEKISTIDIPIGSGAYTWERYHPVITTELLEEILFLGDNIESELDRRGIAKFLVGGEYSPIQTIEDLINYMDCRYITDHYEINVYLFVNRLVLISSNTVSHYDDNDFYVGEVHIPTEYNQFAYVISEIISYIFQSYDGINGDNFGYFISNNSLYEVDKKNKKLYYIPLVKTTLEYDGTYLSDNKNTYPDGYANGFYYVPQNKATYAWVKYNNIKYKPISSGEIYIPVNSTRIESRLVMPDEEVEIDPVPPASPTVDIKLYSQIHYDQINKSFTVSDIDSHVMTIYNASANLLLTNNALPYFSFNSRIFTNIKLSEYISTVPDVGIVYNLYGDEIITGRSERIEIVTSNNINEYPINGTIEGFTYYEMIN